MIIKLYSTAKRVVNGWNNEFRVKYLKEIFDYLSNEINKLRIMKKKLFKDCVDVPNSTASNYRVSGKLDFKGVYLIYKDEDEKPFYIGSSGEGKRVICDRINDLFYYNPHPKKEGKHYGHSLTRKANRSDFREFLWDNCLFKAIEVKGKNYNETIRKARMLEHFLIYYLESPQEMPRWRMARLTSYWTIYDRKISSSIPQ